MATLYRLSDTALKAGEAWGHAEIRVTLSDEDGTPVQGHLIGDPGAIVRPFQFHAHPVTGTFTVDLVANAEITPANTCYRVKIGSSVWIIQATADGDLALLSVTNVGPLGPPNASASALAAEIQARIDGDQDLQDQIDAGPGGSATFAGLDDVTLDDPRTVDGEMVAIDTDGTVHNVPGVHFDEFGGGFTANNGDDFSTVTVNTDSITQQVARTSDGSVSEVAATSHQVSLSSTDVAGSTTLSVSSTGAFVGDDEIATLSEIPNRQRVLAMRALWAKLGGTTPGIVQWEGGSNVQGVGAGSTGTGSMVDRTRIGFAEWLGRNDPGLGWVPAFSYVAETPPGNYVFRYGLGFTTASTGAAPTGCTPRPDCGLGGWALEVASGSATPVHTQVGARYAKVYLTAKNTGGGSAQLYVDGVAFGSPVSTTDGTITGTTSAGRKSITWTGSGTTFEVRVTGGNSAIVDGIEFDTATSPAVQHMNGGHAGTDVNNAIAGGSLECNMQHSANNPADLYVLSPGLNFSFNVGNTPTDAALMLADIRTWVDERHAHNPQAGFMFDKQWYGGDDANGKVPPPLDEWISDWHRSIELAVIYCESLGVGAVAFSTYDLWGNLYDPQPTPTDPNDLLWIDNLHPNDRAHKGAGWMLAEIMLPGGPPSVLGATVSRIPNAAGTYDLAVTNRAPTDGRTASYRDGGGVTPGLVRTVWEWLDSNGSQITGINNDGGQFWTDGMSMLRGSAIHAQTAYWPQFRFTFADQVNKRGPIFAFSYVGAGGGTFTNLGDTITIDAGKETYLRVDDNDNIRSSKALVSGAESGAAALVPAKMGPAVGPSSEPGFGVGIFGDARWYRAAIGAGAGWVSDSAIRMTNPTAQVDVSPFKLTPVKAATTGNITLSNSQTIDGVAVANPDRVLVKDQSSPANNGIYTVVDAGSWTRCTDADTAAKISAATVAVQRGTLNGGTKWETSFTAGATLGTTAMTWAKTMNSAFVTAKGDLWGASASGTPARVPVGNNRDRLISDSTATAGVSWEPAAIFARKTGATSRTSTSPSSDPDLTTGNLAISTVYRFQAYLSHQGLATDDISIQVTMPTGCTIEAMVQFPPTNVAAVPWATNSRRLIAGGSAFSSGLVDASTPTATLITGLVVMSTNTGTFAIQWSATANTGTNVTLNAGSWMLLEKVG